MDFDEDFWIEQFGIQGVNDLQKVRFELAQNQKRRLIKQEILGWGSNNFGQLGQSNISMGSNIAHPKNIPLPEELENMTDEILDIKCGRRHSIFYTKSGNVYATGNLKAEKNLRL